MVSLSGSYGSNAEPSPKSHQPWVPPVERLLKVTVSPLACWAKFGTGLPGLMTLLTSGVRYMSAAPETSPKTLVKSALIQPEILLGAFSSAMIVLLDESDGCGTDKIRESVVSSREMFDPRLCFAFTSRFASAKR